jgi:long-chain acyl-CoA synthetase
MYGQTEASARLTMLPPGELDRKRGSAGKAIPDVSINVVRETGDPVEPCEIGEITAEGENVMKGYWGDPAGTEKVLKNGRLHTGDLGYLDEEGYLFITGRSSEIIKSGAFRINPNEIEEVLFQHPDVLEAGVVGIEDEMLGEAIVGVVSLKEGKTTPESHLLSHCAKYLATYKRPKAVFLFAELPKSANGKILRNVLRERVVARYKKSSFGL